MQITPTAIAMVSRHGRRIVPRIQRDASACGPACLAMICEFYGLPVNLAKLRRAAATAIAGTDLKTLRDLARDAGFEARGVRLTLDSLARLSAPAIVHYDGAHFVVVERVDNDGVHVVDPAYGRDRLTTAHFLARWKGITLIIERVAADGTNERETTREGGGRPAWLSFSSPFESASVRAHYKDASRSLAWPVARIVLLAILLQALGLAFPLFAARIIDSAVGTANGGLLVALVGGLVIATIAQLSITGVRDVLLIRIKLRWQERFFESLFRHVSRFPLQVLDRYKREDLVARFQASSAIRQIFSAGFVQGALDISLIIGYIIVIIVYSRLAGIVCILVGLFLVATAHHFAGAIRSGADQSYKAMVRASGSVLETVVSAETVKLLRLEDARTSHWYERFLHVLRVEGLNEARGIRFRITCGALTSLGQAAIYGIAGAQALSGQLSVGSFAAVTAIYVMATSRVQMVSTLWIEASSVLVALTKMNDLLQEDRECAPSEGKPTRALSVADTMPSDPNELTGSPVTNGRFSLRGTLDIQDVSFRYKEDGGIPALGGVSLTVGVGQRVSVVGRNGSGKSTLLKLISFFYQHYEGNILWGGREARSLPLDAARGRIGCIPQTVHIFEGTVEENLLLACPNASSRRLREALGLSGLLDDFGSVNSVLALPLLTGGSNLSGGQRLKLAFARLFLTDPDVIILDEASSALDPSSERAIIGNLWRVFSDRTVLIAAHRLSTVMSSDVIAVMSHGRIVEQGTHASLQMKQGTYAELLRAYVGEYNP